MEELYHHGVKGQRWGFRRYQNADGSLTPAGKKRYGTKANFEKVQKAKLVAKGKDPKTQREKAREKANARTEKELAKYRKKSGIKDEPETQQQKKTMKDFSNEELKAMTDRMTIEKNYIDAKRNLAAATPKQVNKGKEFAKGIFNEAIRPALINTGKAYLEKTMKEALGLKNDDMEALKKAAEKAGYQKKIYEAKDAAYKNLQNERKEQEYQESQKKKSQKKEEPEHVTGNVEGTGTSSKKKEKTKSRNDDIIDAEFREVNEENVNSGKSFISQLLLEDKKMKHSLTDENEIYHHGVKGQRWGVRRYQNVDGNRKRIGIKENGKLGITTEKASKNAKIKFALRTGVKVAYGAGSLALSAYLSKNPAILIGVATKFIQNNPIILEKATALISNSELISKGAEYATNILKSNPELIKEGTKYATDILKNNPELVSEAYKIAKK